MRGKRHLSLTSFTKKINRGEFLRTNLKIFIAVLLILSNLSASHLNDVGNGTFIDIGKLSGFDEIETPIVSVSTRPIYTQINNILNTQDRLFNLDRCFVDDSGVESCLKKEVLCDGHISYGDNSIVEHNSITVDYMDSTTECRDVQTNAIATTIKVFDGWGVKCNFSGCHTYRKFKNQTTYSCAGVNQTLNGTKCDEVLGFTECEEDYNLQLSELNYTISCEDRANPVPSSSSTCSKEVSFNHYSYGCENGFEIDDKGRTSCSKVDLDLSAKNDIELSESCNNAVPSSQNCYFKWSTCPVDSSKSCAFKGSEYTIYVPLKSFVFDENSFFKEWEYGKNRGWDCTTLSNSGLEKYDCQYGIKEVDATVAGKLCLKDMHNYTTCINYSDNSECILHLDLLKAFL